MEYSLVVGSALDRFNVHRVWCFPTSTVINRTSKSTESTKDLITLHIQVDLFVRFAYFTSRATDTDTCDVFTFSK